MQPLQSLHLQLVLWLKLLIIPFFLLVLTFCSLYPLPGQSLFTGCQGLCSFSPAKTSHWHHHLIKFRGIHIRALRSLGQVNRPVNANVVGIHTPISFRFLTVALVSELLQGCSVVFDLLSQWGDEGEVQGFLHLFFHNGFYDTEQGAIWPVTKQIYFH